MLGERYVRSGVHDQILAIETLAVDGEGSRTRSPAVDELTELLAGLP